MDEFVVRKTISLKAEPSEVWNALTNPEKTKQYFFNCEVFSDWEVGSTILFTGRLFLIKKIELKGQIVQFEPNKLLKYTLQNEDDPDNFSTVTDELTYENGETILSITDDVGQGKGAEDRYKRSEKGWDSILKGLKEVVEGKL
ncbi:SRPBCC family protein [Spirosoma foliorum]|uniref:SRPBCC domain-containing protein n=1 Tax=Spirosoma foliorum TaxID=2710596 RepID=A0A7G5GNY2_9BACT|nr:SRPBCC domain-containing protein [Spirosoma foliorum]QMW00574.1 SRPBCC domain-containing protein [Spirosoma foliorum]